MNRRTVLKLMGSAGLALTGGRLAAVAADEAAKSPAGAGVPDAVWVENGEPAQLLAAALKEMGGLSRFVSKDDIVVIKPNIGWDRSPEQAANTNPDLIAELVRECFNAGAKKVRIFDRTCNSPRRCYANSGIEEKAAALGADVSHINLSRFSQLKLKDGEILKEWPIYRDYMETNKVINVPVAKHHGLSRVTLGLKNLMGVMGGDRGKIHEMFDIKLIDITGAILPALTIVDGYRILLRHGPQGGNIKDVKLARTLVMSPCCVAADHASLALFGVTPGDVPYLREAVRRGINKVNIAKMNLKKITL